MILAAGWLPMATTVAFVFLLLALAGAFFRVIRGPSLPDRVIALDLLSVILVAMCAVYAAATGERSFLDVALALALVAFFTTAAFARYVERRGRTASDGPDGGGGR